MRAESCPERAEKASMTTVTGSRARPDSSGLYPFTIWSSTGSRNRAPPRAP